MSIYKGDTLLVGNIPNSANQDLSNLSNTGQAVIDNKTDIDMSNISTAGKIAITNIGYPTATSKAISLQSSGASYTSPEDGWMHVTLTLSQGGYLAVKDIYTEQGNSTASNVSIFCPVRKGEVFTIKFTNRTSTPRCRFYYAVGTESEAT